MWIKSKSVFSLFASWYKQLFNWIVASESGSKFNAALFFLLFFFVFRCLSCEIVISFGIVVRLFALSCYMRHKFIILQLIERVDWARAVYCDDMRWKNCVKTCKDFETDWKGEFLLISALTSGMFDKKKYCVEVNSNCWRLNFKFHFLVFVLRVSNWMSFWLKAVKKFDPQKL